MKLEINKEELYTSIKLMEEKLDTRIAPNLKGEFVLLNTEGISNVILNLEHVKFADSAGLSSILVANRLCEDAGGALVICGLSDHVSKLITIACLNSVLYITRTEKEAIDAFYLAEMEAQLEQKSEEQN